MIDKLGFLIDRGRHDFQRGFSTVFRSGQQPVVDLLFGGDDGQLGQRPRPVARLEIVEYPHLGRRLEVNTGFVAIGRFPDFDEAIHLRVHVGAHDVRHAQFTGAVKGIELVGPAQVGVGQYQRGQQTGRCLMQRHMLILGFGPVRIDGFLTNEGQQLIRQPVQVIVGGFVVFLLLVGTDQLAGNGRVDALRNGECKGQQGVEPVMGTIDVDTGRTCREQVRLRGCVEQVQLPLKRDLTFWVVEGKGVFDLVAGAVGHHATRVGIFRTNPV